jgi:hypothetical protein
VACFATYPNDRYRNEEYENAGKQKHLLHDKPNLMVNKIIIELISSSMAQGREGQKTLQQMYIFSSDMSSEPRHNWTIHNTILQGQTKVLKTSEICRFSWKEFTTRAGFRR